MARSNQVMREIQRVLLADGPDLSVSRGSSMHYIIRNSAGGIVAVVASSPGDSRWLRNLKADVRRAARKTG